MGDKKSDVLYKGLREYTEQMSNAFENWNEDHPNQPITKEELEEAHSLLKKLVIEKADALIAKSWWPTRVNWKSFRKMMDRQIDRQYSHFCEFNGLREEWCNEKKIQMKIAEIIKELKEEMEKCKANEKEEPKRMAELEGQLRANQKVEKQSKNRQKEWALKMEVANKKYELRMQNHLDNHKSAKTLRHGTEMIHLATIPTHAHHTGLVVGGIFALGTLAAYLIRSRKRKQEIKKLDKMIAECSKNDDDDDEDDEDKDNEEKEEEEEGENGQKYMDENYMNEKIELI